MKKVIKKLGKVTILVAISLWFGINNLAIAQEKKSRPIRLKWKL